MRFVTTRTAASAVQLRTALLDGLAPDGGLYVPETIETMAAAELARLPQRTLTEVAYRALRPYTRDQLDATVQQELEKAIEHTKFNTGMIFTVALNYGGRAEIVDAVNRILNNGVKSNGAVKGPIGEAEFSKYLYTAGLPDPDLLIRTSGELRVSNFLLWQIAYAEIYVTETLWPDFCKKELYEAIIAFQKRERRYGGLERQLVRETMPAGDE